MNLKLTKVFGIYEIKNLINGKKYIGSTITSFSIRWRQWKWHLRKGTGNRHLQNAWNKYGEDNFSFEILEVVKDKIKVLEREQYYIDILKPEYNICPKAGNCAGVVSTRKGTRLINRNCPICSKPVSKSSSGHYGKTCGSLNCMNTLRLQKPASRLNKRSIMPCPICQEQRKECYLSDGRFSKYQKTCGKKDCIMATKGRPKGKLRK